MVNTLVNTNPSVPVSNTPNRVNQMGEKVSIKDFSATTQLSIFQALKQARFSGKLILTDERAIESIFYLYLGRLIFVTGGEHPIRRWTRNLTRYCPEIAAQEKTLKNDLKEALERNGEINWQFQLLTSWVKQNRLNREQLIRLVRSLMSEVLFDLTQSRNLSQEIQPQKNVPTPPLLFNPEEVVVHTWKLWQTWQTTPLRDYSPNLAPVIANPQLLEERSSPLTRQILQERLNGKSSLRDLTISFKQDLIQLNRALSFYFQFGLIQFVEIPDLPGPVDHLPSFSSPVSSQPLVAYVDDSPGMCQRMKHIFTSAGYGFLPINDGQQAIALCLANKPNIIIINAQMPPSNGYQLCQELKQLSPFHHTPILMVVQQKNLIDHLRAKMVGFSAIIEKLAHPEIILNTVTACFPAQGIS